MAETTLSQLHGVLVLNKPKGPTSAHCIAKVKRLGQKKIGHAGTLDPMAQGVLLVLLGQSTKLSGYLMDGGEKVYSGTIELGRITDTWDDEGETLSTADWSGVTVKDVANAISDWIGTSEQQVPSYSAAKHKGQPLYKLAREGKETPVKIRRIDISQAEMLSVELPFVRFRVRCSSGTYIRSLAHSLGTRLGCGAVLTELIREYSHPFSLDEAHELDDVLAEPAELAGKIVSLENALPHWPKLRLSAAAEANVKNGIPHPYDPAEMANMPFDEGIKAMLLSTAGEPLALAETQFKNGAPVWAILRGLWNT